MRDVSAHQKYATCVTKSIARSGIDEVFNLMHYRLANLNK